MLPFVYAAAMCPRSYASVFAPKGMLNTHGVTRCLGGGPARCAARQDCALGRRLVGGGAVGIAGKQGGPSIPTEFLRE